MNDEITPAREMSGSGGLPANMGVIGAMGMMGENAHNMGWDEISGSASYGVWGEISGFLTSSGSTVSAV